MGPIPTSYLISFRFGGFLNVFRIFSGKIWKKHEKSKLPFGDEPFYTALLYPLMAQFFAKRSLISK
jgi:hypothetical protein